MNCPIARLVIVPCMLLALVASLIAGCLPVREGKIDAALFVRSPASGDAKPNAQIAVVADAALTQSRYESPERLSNRLSYKLVIPIGQIVEAATVAALADEFDSPIAKYPSFEAASKAAGPVAQLTLVAPRPAQFELHYESLPLVIPFPWGVVPMTTRDDVRLMVDWQVLDKDGGLMWTKRYDSGDVKLPFEKLDERDFYRESPYVRLAHQVAYKLMREAAHDLKAWFESERLRERVL
jgi:hypothetical protein